MQGCGAEACCEAPRCSPGRRLPRRLGRRSLPGKPARHCPTRPAPSLFPFAHARASRNASSLARARIRCERGLFPCTAFSPIFNQRPLRKHWPNHAVFNQVTHRNVCFWPHILLHKTYNVLPVPVIALPAKSTIFYIRRRLGMGADIGLKRIPPWHILKTEPQPFQKMPE